MALFETGASLWYLGSTKPMHVQSLFIRDLFLLWSFKFSLQYLLLFYVGRGLRLHSTDAEFWFLR